MLCFGFASRGRRRSEIAAADLRDIRRIGAQTYLYRLEHSKTQQAGVTASSNPDKSVLDRAALALDAWLDAVGYRGRDLPMAACRAKSDFGPHSLCSRFVTEASSQDVELPAIMQMTEHRAVSSLFGYFQTGGATTNPVARLSED